ncbi:MAG: dipeptide epimerase [Pseudomonadota bacterium]
MLIHSRKIDRPLVAPFKIARGLRTSQASLHVDIEDGGTSGAGEASGVQYNGETAETMLTDVSNVRSRITNGLNWQHLATVMKPGGARAAIDAALWDLEAKQSGIPAWRTAGLEKAPGPLTTAYTISLDTPEIMASKAEEYAHLPLLKLKIGGSDFLDTERVKAVRRAAPNTRLVADGNGGCLEEELPQLMRAMADNGFGLLEQPFTRETDERLRGLDTPLPLCADESLATLEDMGRVASLYQMGNIKLDKCGGLTSALAIAEALRDRDMGVFVGSMLGGTLSIAPAFIVAAQADYVDLDPPLWIKGDNYPLALDANNQLPPPPPEVWGM